MPEDNQDYGALPRLRAQLAERRAAGDHPEATELAAEIERLTAAAKREAARVVRERAETKERFQGVVRSIRELQGSAAEVPGGPEARDARIRELASQARVEKARHEELTERIRQFTWFLTGDAQNGPHAERFADDGALTEAEPTRDLDRPRRRWLVPAIVGAAIVVLGAGLFAASLVVDARVGRTLEARLTDVLQDQDLDEIVTYDDFSVSSLLGSATFHNIAIIDSVTDTLVRIDRVTVRVPRLEALRARTALAGDDATDIQFSSLVLDVERVLATGSEGEAFQVESVRVALEGDLRQSLLVESPEDQILQIDRADITIEEAELLGFDAVLDGIREVGWSGDVRDLTRLDEFHAELSHDRSAREFILSEYRLATPLFTQSGDVRIAYAGDLQDSSAWMREVGFELQSAIRESPGAFVLRGDGSEESIVIDIPQIELTLSGATAFADELMELELGRSTADVSLVIGEGAAALPPSALEELSWYLEDIDELLSAGAVRLERFALEAGLGEDGAIDLRELSLRAPFVDFILSGQATIDDIDAMLPGSVSLSGSVERLPQSLREPLGQFAIMLGAIMPASGPFEFSLSLDESGEPVLAFE